MVVYRTKTADIHASVGWALMDSLQGLRSTESAGKRRVDGWRRSSIGTCWLPRCKRLTSLTRWSEKKDAAKLEISTPLINHGQRPVSRFESRCRVAKGSLCEGRLL
ncbi:MAG: hypothetical protein CMM01_08680 [Rhodopirellula sp.]|nr:hypothetical protein [Rhodopirellula sp.]